MILIGDNSLRKTPKQNGDLDLGSSRTEINTQKTRILNAKSIASFMKSIECTETENSCYRVAISQSGWIKQLNVQKLKVNSL